MNIHAFQKIALKQKTFQKLLSKGGSFGIISAYVQAPKKENQIRHGMLIADLQKLGYRKIQNLRGQWEGVSEKSLLIPNIKPKDLFVLGRKYKQEAVIYKSADGVVGMYYPSGHAEVAVDSEGLPQYEIQKGKGLFSKTRNWSFSLGFLWGQRIPWNGRSVVSKDKVLGLFNGGRLSP